MANQTLEDGYTLEDFKSGKVETDRKALSGMNDTNLGTPLQTPQSTFDEKLDEILVKFFNEAEKDVHSDNFVEGLVITKAGTNAKAAITSLVLESLGDEIDVNKISSAHDLYSGMPAPYAKGFRDGFNTAQGMIFAQQRSIITKDIK